MPSGGGRVKVARKSLGFSLRYPVTALLRRCDGDHPDRVVGSVPGTGVGAMVKRVAAGLLVLVLLLGGGWLVLRHLAETRLQDAIAQFRASLGPDDRFTYASAEPAPLHLGAVFTAARLRWQGADMDVARMTLAGLGRNRLGSAHYEDVHFRGNGVAGTVAGIDASDVSAPEGSRSLRWNALSIGGLGLHDLAVRADNFPGAGVRVADLHISQIPDGHGGMVQDARIQEFRIQGADGQPVASIGTLTHHASGSPDAMLATTGIAGIVIAPDSALGQRLAQIGYPGATGDGRSVIRYSAQSGATPGAAGRLDLDPVSIRLAGVGRLAMTLGLDRLPPLAAGQVTATQLNQQMMQARLTGLTLTYDDAGLVGHALAALAQRSGMTVSQLRAALVQTLQQRAAADGGAGFEQQAIRFLDDPRHLLISLHPPAPLPLSELATLQAPAGPADAIRTLGLDVKAD